MKVYIKNVPYMGITTTLTDKELMIIVQAVHRGLAQAKIKVTFLGQTRMLAVEAIDLSRTCPDVVFERITTPPIGSLLSADFGRPSFLHCL